MSHVSFQATIPDTFEKAPRHRRSPRSPVVVRPRRRALLLATLLAISVATPVDAARVEIILDASGSMRASAGGNTKMQAAQEAVLATIRAIDASSNVALRLYGHRLPSEPKDPSCRDTELVIPFGPLDRERFVAAVETARPLGQTPLAYSLEKAAEDLGNLGDEAAAVILVSDGEESCGGDPVAVACTFATQGLDLTIHTVGFDVEGAARRQLQEIARCTGGEYRDARNAGELSESLQQLTQAGLLLEKQSAYGRDVRGGDTYDQAVTIEPGVEYRLDHHQRQNQYDFFKIDVRGGQKLVATVQTIEKGVNITGDTFRESGNPYAGIEIHGPDRRKIGDALIIGTRNGRKSVEVPTSHERAGTFHVLVGNSLQDQHKDARFQLELIDQYDAGSDRDAPGDEEEALNLPPGQHAGWLHANDRVDYYIVQADPQAVYELRVRPEQDEKRLRVTVIDGDGVQVARGDAPNPGAAVRLQDLQFRDGGNIFVKVESHPTFSAQQRIETAYTLELAGKGGELAEQQARATDAGEPSSDEPREIEGAGEGGASWFGPIAVGVGALLAISVAAFALRRRSLR